MPYRKNNLFFRLWRLSSAGGIVNSSSPLRYDDRMLGGMLTFGRAGQVLVITPFVLAGAMSPITIASAVAPWYPALLWKTVSTITLLLVKRLSPS